MITPSIDFEEVKRSFKISDILIRYRVPFKAVSRNEYRLPCPLHNGDGDNFAVDERKGIYFCFVCHKGGSVIDLVMELENCTLKEALEKLVGEHPGRFSTNSSVSSYRQMERKVQDWKELRERPPSITVEVPETIPLESGYRGLSDEAIKVFGLRRIPGEGWGTGVYIPFREVGGEVVGYTIRHPEGLMREDGKKAPKYLNTKGDLKDRGYLYGINEAVDAIREIGTAILVEGQFDAISLWDKGFKNVVSVMGSFLTNQQAMRLMPLATKLVVIFDGDEAGREGAQKLKKHWRSTFDISVFILPEGTDPATYNFT